VSPLVGDVGDMVTRLYFCCCFEAPDALWFVQVFFPVNESFVFASCVSLSIYVFQLMDTQITTQHRVMVLVLEKTL
jgi:hypothetical protein